MADSNFISILPIEWKSIQSGLHCLFSKITHHLSKNSFKRLNRTIHYWGALLCAIPIVIVIITGVLLLLKKDIEWVQPASARGVGNHPVISFERIINSVRSTHNGADVEWADINRLDVRPGKGLVKVRLKNNWEIQIDATNGHILAENYRRSDIIEAIHASL